jgi:hypothetical protein
MSYLRPSGFNPANPPLPAANVNPSVVIGTIETIGSPAFGAQTPPNGRWFFKPTNPRSSHGHEVAPIG